MPGGPPPHITGAQIAADAARYIGLGYVFGGIADRPGDWDCSSFVSYVLGHDLGLALPGGRWGEPGFPPTSHGPVVVSYANWTLALTIPESQAAPGDLVCFVGLGASGHIGIVTGHNQMISALNPDMGTLRSPIVGYGPYGAPIIYRRILGIPAGVSPAPPGVPQTGWNALSPLQQGVLILLVMGGIVAGAVGLAAIAGTGGAVLTGILARKLASGGSSS